MPPPGRTRYADLLGHPRTLEGTDMPAFILWGLRVIYRTLGNGVFFCRRCGGDRKYRHRTAGGSSLCSSSR